MGIDPVLVVGFLLGVASLVLPLNWVIVLSIVAVFLADTRFVSKELIYYIRFIPVSVLAFRSVAMNKGGGVRLRSLLIVSWLPFVIYAWVSATYSMDPNTTLQRLISMSLVLVGFGLGIPNIIGNEAKTRRLIWAVTTVMTITSYYSYFAGDLSDVVSFRASGFFKNPNTLGLVATEAFFLLIYLIRGERSPIRKYSLYAAVIATGLIVIITGSRASFLGLVIGVGSLAIIERHRFRRSFFGIAIIPVFIGTALFISSYISQDINTFLFRRETSGRDVLFERDVQLMRDQLPFGAGFGGSDGIYFLSTLDLQSRGLIASGSHNSFMKLLVELGPLGVLLATWALLRILVPAYRLLQHFRDPFLGVCMFSVVVGCLANSFLEDWLFGFGSGVTVPFWLFLAILSNQTNEAAGTLKNMQAAGKRSTTSQRRSQIRISRVR